jgi:hypothetical protein
MEADSGLTAHTGFDLITNKLGNYGSPEGQIRRPYRRYGVESGRVILSVPASVFQGAVGRKHGDLFFPMGGVLTEGGRILVTVLDHRRHGRPFSCNFLQKAPTTANLLRGFSAYLSLCSSHVQRQN